MSMPKAQNPVDKSLETKSLGRARPRRISGSRFGRGRVSSCQQKGCQLEPRRRTRVEEPLFQISRLSLPQPFVKRKTV